MSLATRCPACGTVFRVVPDQLKVSEGWVRCGRCTEVFDGAQQLFELDSAGPAAGTPPAPGAVPSAAGPQSSPALTPEAAHEALTAAPAAAAVPREEPIESHASVLAETPLEAATPLAAETPDAGTAEPAAEISCEPSDDAPDQAPDEALAETPAEPSDPQYIAMPSHADASAETPSPPGNAGAATPQFVRRADRAARWQHPRRRALLAAAAMLLTSTLAAQLALHYRDALAATWPATRPLLQAGCSLAGCRIEAPRQMQSLAVDGSSLARLPDSALYRLSLVVHNKASTPVRMPAVELTMTDAQGRIVARRVLSAAELGQAVEQLPAGGELVLQTMLDLGSASVAGGYSVELFYP